jgi:hypothetical protein
VELQPIPLGRVYSINAKDFSLGSHEGNAKNPVSQNEIGVFYFHACHVKL